jgi:hypothetical protein
MAVYLRKVNGKGWNKLGKNIEKLEGMAGAKTRR